MLHARRLSGTIPASYSRLAYKLNRFDVAQNELTGDLGPLGSTRLVHATVHNNPGLCGMVPASVRFAKGYNPAGTRLGQPCD